MVDKRVILAMLSPSPPPLALHRGTSIACNSALGVLRGMQQDQVPPDRNSYFFVISACSQTGEARTALKLLGEMRQGQVSGGPEPDLLLYGVVIKACAGGRLWRQALQILEEMELAGGETFGQAAWWVARQLQQGHGPRPRAWGALLGVLHAIHM